MLFSYQLPNVSTIVPSGANFTGALNTTLNLWDKRPGKKTLFTQTAGGTQTLTLTVTLNNADTSLDFNTLAYPYLLVGVVNIGNGPFNGQILPSCVFTPNGKWGASGVNARTVVATVGPTGYSSAWAVIPRAAIVGGVDTTVLTLAMTANFQTGFGNFGIGEVIIAGAIDLPTMSMSMDPTDPTALNRSSGNVPWPALRRPYRKYQNIIVPRTRQDALSAVAASYPQTMQRMILQSARQGACVISPLWRNLGSTIADTPTLLENCHMARIVAPFPSIAGGASDTRFGTTFVTEELL